MTLVYVLPVLERVSQRVFSVFFAVYGVFSWKQEIASPTLRAWYAAQRARNNILSFLQRKDNGLFEEHAVAFPPELLEGTWVHVRLKDREVTVVFHLVHIQ